MRPAMPSRSACCLQRVTPVRRRRYGRSARRDRRQQRQRSSRSSKPFFSDGAADRQQDHRVAPDRCHRPCAARGRRREAVEIEPVIERGSTLPGDGASAGEMIAARRRCRSRPSGRGQLVALLPLGRGPDVLGVRRNGPAAARASSRRSARPRPACAGNARADGRYRAAVRPPAPAPDRSGGRGSASDRAPDRRARHGARRRSRAAGGPPPAARATRRGASCRYSGR